MAKHGTVHPGAEPLHYELHFEPDFKEFRFRARAEIQMRAEKPIRSIRLNSKELKIKSAIVECAGKKQIAGFEYGDEEITLNFKEKAKGKFNLIIEYEGEHNDKLYGFYRSSYKEGGKANYLLTTQFEAPNARAAFPCMDEPEFKATFAVSMLVDKGMEAISNMPIKGTKAKGSRKLVEFQATPKMSTYLLYLGVGKFDSKEGKSAGIRLRVMGKEGSAKYVALPLEYSKRLWADLQRYFVIQYPLPKLDLIGIPDFAAGAMENWGAMTFRETALLGDENTSMGGRQRIAEVVAHEMAHQWFGDLVTMKWWDDMWLNESFATFMAYRSLARVFPEWKSMLAYYLETVGDALAADGMKNTHPISVDVKTAGQIEELFDAIGYEKGGSVLLMLEDFVGPEKFRKGLVRYLKENSYSNATKKDLWRAMEKESGQRKVVTIMEDWVNREGYPIIGVRKKDNAFELTQERFTISGNMPGIWKIPITYVSEKGTGRLVMEKKKAMIKNAGKWIKLNYGQAGFYRVDYEQENLEILGKMIRGKRLEDHDIWGIENDLFASVRSGEKPIGSYVNFVKDFCMDCGYPANSSISSHLGWLNLMAHKAPFAQGARELSIAFHRKLLTRLGWESKKGESSMDTRLRPAAISALCMLGERGTLAKAESVFQKGRIDANLRPAVFFASAYSGPSREKFQKFLEIYGGNGSPEEKVTALRAIGMLGDEGLLRDALMLGGKIRLQDSLTIPLAMAGANPKGKFIYKKWALANWKKLMGKYPPSSHMLRGCVSAFGSLSDWESKKELEKFFKNKKNMRDDIRIAAKQALERIDANIRFMERNSN